MSKSYLGIIGFVLLAGCATGMSEEECATANWGTIGYEDGRDGRGMDKYAERTEQCGKFEVLPDQDQYLQGRDRGLVVYCTPQSGLAAGKNGQRYQGVCPAEKEPAFLEAHSLGMEYHLAKKEYESAVDAYNSNVDSIRSYTYDVNRKIDKYNDSTDPDERANLMAEINRLKSQISSLRSSQYSLRYDADEQERRFRSFRLEFADREKRLMDRLLERSEEDGPNPAEQTTESGTTYIYMED